MERCVLLVGDQAGTVPEHERHDEEDHGLRQGPQEVAPECRLLRVLQRLVETAGVDVAAVLLTSERSDGTNSTCSLASELGGVLVRALVHLVLKDDDTL